MSLPVRLAGAPLSPLARHFAVFCAELDPAAGDTALFSAALLAERNEHGDTCLHLAALAGQPLLHDAWGEPLFTAPALAHWLAALPCGFIGAPGDGRPLVLDGERLYLRRHWREECLIAEGLRRRFVEEPLDHPALRARLDALFVPRGRDDAGSHGQKLAAAIALGRRLAIVTGGPGTGKTTTVTRILALLLEQRPGLRIALAAPTGKAAARLSESIAGQLPGLRGLVPETVIAAIPRQASTLHRLLGWRPQGFEYHAANPLPCDCLLIDETSMVDQGLMADVLAALPDACRLILLGDRNQLSSVEAGSVLGDITGQGRTLGLSAARAAELEALTGAAPARPVGEVPPIADHVAELTHSYRFASGGGIGRLAEAVKRGDVAAAEAVLATDDGQLDWLEAGEHEPPQALIERALAWYRPVLTADSPEQALQHFEQARILTARNDGPWGGPAILERLETALRREGLLRARPGQPYRGQPVIVLSNDHETGLFNGDTGVLWPDPEEAGTLLAWFPRPDGLRPFSLHQLPAWQTAWTLTVHRSQGSEYPRVLLVLPGSESRVVDRELIYTGITRAARHCCIVAGRERFLEALRTTRPRHSGLAGRLGWTD